MLRFVWFSLLLVLGLGLVVWGLLVPSHLRAVDIEVLQEAGEETVSLSAKGQDLLSQEKIGPAWVMLKAALRLDDESKSALNRAVGEFARENPDLLLWGGTDPYLQQVFARDHPVWRSDPEPVIKLLLSRQVRQTLWDYLRASRRTDVQEMMRTRDLEGYAVFPPARSASGQPLEAAILLTGLLLQGDYLNANLRAEVIEAARVGIRGEGTERLEGFFLDLLSLGNHLNWVQMTELLKNVEKRGTVRTLAHLVRAESELFPVVYAGVMLTGQPDGVVAYVTRFGETGLEDLGLAAKAGGGAVEELLQRGVRVYAPPARERWVRFDPVSSAFGASIRMAEKQPTAAFFLKYGMILMGAFCLAGGVRQLRRRRGGLERSLEVRWFGVTRQAIFAVFFLLLAIAVSEPYLAQEGQEMRLPLRLVFPTVDSALMAEVSEVIKPVMNEITYLILGLFLVIQLVIYVAGLVKIAEIRKQPVGSRLKLKLLDNEENMFDAGLYVGLGGTVTALVLLALKVVEPSLMAAYASTLFGLIFVALLKICHLRPYRRVLILESEPKA